MADQLRWGIPGALKHHLGRIAATDRLFAIPAHARDNDLNRKSAALEHGHRQMAPLQ
jgi:hypothetical protein